MEDDYDQLERAADCGDDDAAKRLFRDGWSVTDDALFIAARHGYTSTVQLFIDEDRCRTLNLSAALSIASNERWCIYTVKALIRAGADPCGDDNFGRPLTNAAKGWNTNIVLYLLHCMSRRIPWNYGPVWIPVAMDDNHKIVSALQSAGATIERRQW